jgi:hypothetical protein
VTGLQVSFSTYPASTRPLAKNSPVILIARKATSSPHLGSFLMTGKFAGLGVYGGNVPRDQVPQLGIGVASVYRGLKTARVAA